MQIASRSLRYRHDRSPYGIMPLLRHVVLHETIVEDLKSFSITEPVELKGFNLEWDDARAFPESLFKSSFRREL